jgi:hypothetical protein
LAASLALPCCHRPAWISRATAPEPLPSGDRVQRLGGQIGAGSLDLIERDGQGSARSGLGLLMMAPPQAAAQPGQASTSPAPTGTPQRLTAETICPRAAHRPPRA